MGTATYVHPICVCLEWSLYVCIYTWTQIALIKPFNTHNSSTMTTTNNNALSITNQFYFKLSITYVMAQPKY